MHNYQFLLSNPEYVELELNIQHSKKFSKTEFNKICENALVYAYEKEYKKEKIVLKSVIPYDYLIEFLKLKKFIIPEKIKYQEHFHLDLYCGSKYVKSNKLKQWLTRKDFEDAPKYFKNNP